MKADLHIHTELSDGKDSAEKIISKIRKINPPKEKVYISFVDHNHLAQERILDYQNISVIPGVEVSVQTKQVSLHLTAYSLEPKMSPDLELWLKTIRDGYQKRAKKIYMKIKGLSFDIGPFPKVRKKGLPLPVYTYDLANKLKKTLGFSSEEQVLLWSKENGDLLKVRERNFLPNSKISIDMLHKAGFKVFWAHPGSRFLKAKEGKKPFETIVFQLKKEGLDGIEVFYPAHTTEQTTLLEKYAQKLNLAISGGSDYHGVGRGEKSFFFILPEHYVAAFIKLLEFDLV